MKTRKRKCKKEVAQVDFAKEKLFYLNNIKKTTVRLTTVHNVIILLPRNASNELYLCIAYEELCTHAHNSMNMACDRCTKHVPFITIAHFTCWNLTNETITFQPLNSIKWKYETCISKLLIEYRINEN